MSNSEKDASTITRSRLLSLPAELRLDIWEFLLAPKEREAQWVGSDVAITTISRQCFQTAYFAPLPYRRLYARAHEWSDIACSCRVHPFYLLPHLEYLAPAILRVCRSVYVEALPSLYRRRLFVASTYRTYTSLHSNTSDAWFLMDNFLATLSDAARANIQAVRVPMILSNFEVYGCRDAFYSISSRLQNLKLLDLEVSLSTIRGHVAEADEGHVVEEDEEHVVEENVEEATQHSPHSVGTGDDRTYWLGPVMAFADSNLRVVAVDKHGLNPRVFNRIKTMIEIDVWRQLLPLRTKRDSRRISRLRRALDDFIASRTGEDELAIFPSALLA
ncbi:hypothetical protein EJ06DRAFT_39206 [Trichodelitschia bisporula]|uniref:DUF7730 domain-containing protein n=1 Tax=Trichodelitschia bisporula TaxID=703511 RepID=A0A6G1HVH8_9PEZI|nr:hypothetical protein EJ06DRAFT_39206 [Trichodelitschia bisporula]